MAAASSNLLVSAKPLLTMILVCGRIARIATYYSSKTRAFSKASNAPPHSESAISEAFPPAAAVFTVKLRSKAKRSK